MTARGSDEPPRKRVAKKAERGDSPKLAAVTAMPAVSPGTLLEVLEQSVKSMDWLAPSDEAMVELAREYCRRIDETKTIADEWDQIAGPLREMAEITESKALMARLVAVEKALDVSRQVGWLGPHLANTLRDLGGAPGERKGLQPDGPVNGKLREIRAAAAGRKGPRSR